MLQGVVGWNKMGESKRGEAEEKNDMKLTLKNLSVTSGHASLFVHL